VRGRWGAAGVAETKRSTPMPETPKRALVIVNANSLQGRADLAAELDGLRSQGLDLALFEPERPEDLPALIHAHHAGRDLAIIGGGDGTMSLAAEALIAHRLALGILPLGTANDLARSLAIPTSLQGACEVIAQGWLQPIDLGKVNDRLFFNVASLGLGAAVQRFHRGERKRRWKVLSYVFSLADAFKVTRSFHAEIECDGKRQRLRCIHLAVGNGRHYGGGMTIAEDAAIDDGMLDLYALRPQSFSELLMLAPALRWGTHGQAERTLALRGCRIRVETTRPMRINADGEIVGTTPADFTVLPKALHVMVPRPEVAEAPGLHGHAA